LRKVPTSFPKASPSELQGLLVLLNEHRGNEDVARLADDLDLEIDEILPSLDYAETLGLVKVVDGRAKLTDVGHRMVSASIRERKTILRDQLKKTTLFKTILRALEGAPGGRLTEDAVQRLLAFTTAPSDSYVLNIINWGRYAELFRYDSNEHALIAVRPRAPGRTPPSTPPSNPGAPGQGPARAKPGPTVDATTPLNAVAYAASAVSA
jgi:NitT/TauT family transport system ATP-binding protein